MDKDEKYEAAADFVEWVIEQYLLTDTSINNTLCEALAAYERSLNGGSQRT